MSAGLSWLRSGRQSDELTMGCFLCFRQHGNPHRKRNALLPAPGQGLTQASQDDR